MLCSQYGEIAFFGGLTASPEPLQPGTTRCDVTLMRESQRRDGVGLVFGKIFALSSRIKRWVERRGEANPLQKNYLPSKGTQLFGKS